MGEPRPIRYRSVVRLFACLKTLLELVNTSACIDKLLLAGEEGMALGANFYAYLTVCVALGRTGGNSFAACAADSYFFVFGMYSSLHRYSP